MRLLIELSSRRQEWDNALSPAKDRPRLPLPFSCTTAFLSRGHQISAFNFSATAPSELKKGIFHEIYGAGELPRALCDTDLAFFWASSGIRAIAANRRTLPTKKKVLLGTYVWGVPAASRWKVHRLDLATRLAARFARGVVVMTEEQKFRAMRSLGRRIPVIKFTWGIDSAFYRCVSREEEVDADVRDQVQEIINAGYVIVLGDQQRLESDAIELVERHGISLVRVPQEKATAQWYREQIARRGLEGRLFVFEHVNYPTLRFLLQHSLAYVGTVDSQWQPAGWTVLCEALASGTPAVVYDGLTPRDMRKLGAGPYLKIVPHGDVGAMAAACKSLGSKNNQSKELSARARDFAATVLDLERTGPAFARQVEEILGEGARHLNVVLANPGTQHSLHLARELDRRLLLDSFYTGVAWKSGRLLALVSRLAPVAMSRRLESRICEISHGKLRCRIRNEFLALRDLKQGADEQRAIHRRNELFQQSISDEELRRADAVIGVDTASWILTRRARDFGRPFLLDQTIGHPRSKDRIYQMIRRRFPDWESDLEVRDDAVSDAEDIEHQLATRIVAASSFTVATLTENGVPLEKIVMNPYGVDLERFSPAQKPAKDRPFRFVFAGVVCARKGIPLLLEAWTRLQPKDAELWIVGPLTPTASAKCRSTGNMKIVGKIPNAELASIMSQSDVFVFPSYFEGFGLVLLEAMAAGLPVLTTTATAAPDIFTDGKEGFIIEPGDLDALVIKMDFCLNNRQRLAEMGRQARATAERFSWEAYGQRWEEILSNLDHKTTGLQDHGTTDN